MGVTGGTTVSGTDVSYTIDNSVAIPAGLGSGTTGALNFTLTNVLGSGDILSSVSSLTLAWAMTCANDVIYASTQLPVAPPTTPLPASLPLFVAGIGLLGWLGSKRKKHHRASRIAIA